MSASLPISKEPFYFVNMKNTGGRQGHHTDGVNETEHRLNISWF